MSDIMMTVVYHFTCIVFETNILITLRIYQKHRPNIDFYFTYGNNVHIRNQA